MNSRIDDKFGRVNYFIFVTVDKKSEKIESEYIKENPHKEKSVRAGFYATNFIVKENIDVLITKEMGGISFHALRDNLVDIYRADGKNVKEVIDKFIKNKLERLSEPTKEPEEEMKPDFVPIEKRRRGRRIGREPWWRRL